MGRRLTSPALYDATRDAGLGEVIVVFRNPFDMETIERIGEVRATLGNR